MPIYEHEGTNNLITPQVAALLIAAGADTDAKDLEGRTPLHFAAQTGNMECMKVLLRNRANLKVKDRFGHTAADVAVMHDREEIICELIEKRRIDCTAKNGDGLNLLQLAVEWNAE